MLQAFDFCSLAFGGFVACFEHVCLQHSLEFLETTFSVIIRLTCSNYHFCLPGKSVFRLVICWVLFIYLFYCMKLEFKLAVLLCNFTFLFLTTFMRIVPLLLVKDSHHNFWSSILRSKSFALFYKTLKPLIFCIFHLPWK